MGAIDSEIIRLTQAKLGPRDLRKIAGLSYRQLNEWDKREFLVAERKSPRGWRSVDGWHAMALTIVADLRRQYGIPLSKQRMLLGWLLGRIITWGQYVDVYRAEGELFDFTGEEKEEFEEWILEAYEIATEFSRGIDEGPEDGPDAPDLSPLNGPPVGMALTQSLECFVPRLQERGWPREQAVHFAERFFEVARIHKVGIPALEEYPELMADALAVEDDAAIRATYALFSSLIPVFDAFLVMRVGHPALLVTDLRVVKILQESNYVDLLKRDKLRESMIVVRVNGHINSVLQSVLGKTVAMSPRPDIATSDLEKQVLSHLRTGDFDRLAIDRGGEGFRLGLERNLADLDEQGLLRRLAEHEFQTITVKKHRGEIVRMLQSIHLTRQSPDGGESPTRRPTRE